MSRIIFENLYNVYKFFLITISEQESTISNFIKLQCMNSNDFVKICLLSEAFNYWQIHVNKIV